LGKFFCAKENYITVFVHTASYVHKESITILFVYEENKYLYDITFY